MHRSMSLVPLICGLLCVLPPVAAGAANQLDSDENISLSLRGADLAVVLSAMGKITGVAVDAGPGISGTIDIDLEDVPWQKALGRICEGHRLSCQQLSGDPGSLRIRAIPAADLYRDAFAVPGYAEPISLSLRNADAAVVVQMFEILSGWQVQVDPAFSGKTTAQLQNAPWPVVLEEACRLSGCRVEWSQTRVAIRPGPRETFDLALAEVELGEALGRITPRVLGGRFPVALEIPEGFAPRVTAALSGVTYAEAVDALCEQARCRWQLRYGDPLVLSLEEDDARLQQTVSIDADPLAVREVAAILARSSGLEVDFGALVDPDRTVTMPLEDATVETALTTLSRRLGGSWRKTGDRIVLEIGHGALKDRPDAGRIEPDEIVVRVQTPEAAERATWARFTWVRPTAALATGPDTRAQLYWVPFAADRRVLIGALVGCDGETSVEWLDPVPLPLSASRTLRSADRLVEVAPGPGKEPQVAPRDAAEICHIDVHTRLEAVIRRSRDPREVRSVVSTYLLVTPPSGPSSAPAAAVLVAAVDSDGGYRAALVKPGADAYEVEPVVIRPGQPIERTLPGTDGESWDLRLEVVAKTN